jgi:hypothetical protein
VNPIHLADVLRGAYRVIGQDVPEEQRWLAVAFAAIGALESESTLAAKDALIGRLREGLEQIALHEGDPTFEAAQMRSAARALLAEREASG